MTMHPDRLYGLLGLGIIGAGRAASVGGSVRVSEKPRLVRVDNAAEVSALIARMGELGMPHVYHYHGSLEHGSIVWADADELRAWRASQVDTGAEHG